MKFHRAAFNLEMVIDMDIKDLAGFSEPAKELIQRCSTGLGNIFQPLHTRRMANAESDAAILRARTEVEIDKIKTQGAIEVSEIQQRAIARMLYEEENKQQNIESIVSKALPELGESAKPSQIEEDWLSNFFDKCRLVSDEEMQILWGKVLAGEANEPGTYSKRTINFIRSLDQQEAEKFQSLCRFGDQENVTPLIHSYSDDLYKNTGVTFNSLNELQAIGLINFNGITGYSKIWEQGDKEKTITYKYFDDIFEITITGNKFEVGQVLFTEMGKQIAAICETSPVEEFTSYIVNKWCGLGYKVAQRIIR